MGHSPGKIGGYKRTKGKYIGRMVRPLYDKIIRLITVISRPQALINHAADDPLIALEDNAITGPVFRVNTCRADMQQIGNQILLLLIGRLTRRLASGIGLDR